MNISSLISENGSCITIRVMGRFDFNLVQEFRDAYRELDKPAAEYVIDLRDTDYMDSSALGMLLHLRKFAGGENARIRIINAREGIRKIFSITCFDKKFSVE